MKFDENRSKDIQDNLGKKDALLIYDPKNLYYLCGIEGFGAIGILTSEKFTVFLNENDYEIYKNKSDGKFCIEIYKRGINKDILKKGVEKGEISKIFVDNVGGKTLMNLNNAIGRRIRISDVVERARMIKSESEIESIKKACELTRKGIEVAEEIYLSEKKISERNLAAAVEFFMKLCGSEGTFENGILLACGKNASRIHARPSKCIIKGLMLIDMGAKFNNYFSDMSRTFTEKANKETKALAEFIENLEMICIDKIYKGMKISEISKFAGKEISKNNFKFFHSLGHGIGLSVHEMPSVSNDSKDEFAENMVFTIEPGIYKSDKFGIRFEDICVIRNGKARIL